MSSVNGTQTSIRGCVANARKEFGPQRCNALKQDLVVTANCSSAEKLLSGSAARSASRHGSDRFSRDGPNPGKGHAPRGLKGGMSDPLRKQKLQQEKEAARLALVKFDKKWVQALECLDGILQQEPIRRTYFEQGKARKSQGLVGELNYAVEIHHGIRRLDLHDPKLFSASKQRDKIEAHLHGLLSQDATYQSIGDTYKWLKHSYTERLEDVPGFNDLERFLLDKMGKVDPIKETIAAQSDVISIIERLRHFLREEQARLMNKLDELPSPTPDKSSVRISSFSQMSKRLPGKPTPSKSKKAASATPANRIDIKTPADDYSGAVVTLKGKPRSDNADVVDILNSHGQRTATYIRSPNQQLFFKYSPPDRASGAKTGASRVSLSELSEQMDNLLSEVAEGEKMAEYTSRQPGSSPRSAYDLLEYQANRLRTCAAEVEESKQGFLNAADRERAGTMAQILETRAAGLVEKGQRIRIKLILRAPPTPEHLMYLNDLELLRITQRVRRKPGQRMVFDPVENKQLKQTDFLDEFEITVSGYLWACAHVHYPAADTPAESFAKAHLKQPDQRGATGEGTHYGTFYTSLFKKIFL
ncbi:hypothetical protein [Pseudomonas sp. 65/3-MNA-CIBAN-0223]|uniref:hypothetical protein n=1 Tax=Pseudomonas sp. 65/3-MNA-CIBAN-0223 TaxID=3140476 RepID=UPI003318FEDE